MSVFTANDLEAADLLAGDDRSSARPRPPAARREASLLGTRAEPVIAVMAGRARACRAE